MHPPNLGAIVGTVQHNCHISDALFAGDLTLCTFLLKMRELYRWENDLPLSRELPKDEVGQWMNARSEEWETLEAEPYASLSLAGGEVDPFDTRRINHELLPRGLVYSGGYGRQCKPHFFLGRLDRVEERGGHRVYVAACEYARDLEAPPGMLLDGAIFVRTESLRRLLWEKYEEWRWSHKNEAMGRAFAGYAFERDPETALDAMTARESETVILHELGEALADADLGPAWPDLLAEIMRSRAEIVARAVRDLYADCRSTLPGLIERGEPAPLHFYFANLTGMRRRLFPELAEAYARWVAGGGLVPLRGVARAGQDRWRQTAHELMVLHRELGDAVGAEIEARHAPREAAQG